MIAAECLRRLGRDDEALRLLDEALSSSPIVFRLLDVAIPVAVNVDSSPLAKRLADRVLSCPRFRGDPRGFPLNVRTNDDQLVFELQRPNKLRHCRDSVAANGSAEAVVANALERLDGPGDVTRTGYHACRHQHAGRQTFCDATLVRIADQDECGPVVGMLEWMNGLGKLYHRGRRPILAFSSSYQPADRLNAGPSSRVFPAACFPGRPGAGIGPFVERERQSVEPPIPVTLSRRRTATFRRGRLAR